MALLGRKSEKVTPLGTIWRTFDWLSRTLVIMVRYSNGGVKFAPMFIHQFTFLRPHFLAEAEKFNIEMTDPKKMKTTADKLRYYRHKKGLLQKQVAKYAGINRTTYSAYEMGEYDSYPIDMLKRIAKFLGVKISDLLDEYNTFLYRGQAKQVSALRQRLGLIQQAFAAQLDVNKTAYKRWETGKVRMTKPTWEMMFGEFNTQN